MFERFGEFSSAEEINTLAVNLRKDGNAQSIRELASENGLDEEIAQAFLDGDIPYLCDDATAAIGKIEIEAAELKPAEILEDWTGYIKVRCMEKPEMARKVRDKGKTLKGCIAELIKWSFTHQIPVDKGIMKAAGIKIEQCSMGSPGMETAKKIITDYYMK